MAYEIFNTCLLVPGVSADNCAGWVQAWGSIGAIVFAWFWGNRQAKAALTQALNLQKHEHAEWIRGCIAIARRANHLIDDLSVGLQKKGMSRLPYNAQEMASCKRAVESIPLHELGDPLLVESFFDIGEALEIAERVAVSRVGRLSGEPQNKALVDSATREMNRATGLASMAVRRLEALSPQSPIEW